MIDITSIKPYLEPISQDDSEYINHEVNRVGVENVFLHQLHNLDCSIIKNGYRLQQTIGYTYVSEMTRTIYLIQTYFEDDVDNRLQQVLDLHERNIEFEKINPPIIYGGKRYKNNKSVINSSNKPIKKTKQTRVKFDENGEPIKSVAERKLIAKIGKINALTFKLNKNE